MPTTSGQDSSRCSPTGISGRHHLDQLNRLVSWLLALGLSACSESPSSAPAPPTNSSGSTLDEEIVVPVAGDSQRAAQLLQGALQSDAAVRSGDAHRLFQEALAADPTHRDSRIHLGYFLLRQPSDFTNQGLALRHFRIARLLDPRDAEAALGEGIAREQVGDPGPAEACLELGLQDASIRADRRCEGHLSLARLRYASGKTEQAEQHYGEAVTLAAPLQRSRVRADYATFLSDVGRDAEAHQLLLQNVAEQPDHVKSHYLLSRLLARMGDRDGAAKERRIHGILQQLTDYSRKLTNEESERRLGLRRELVESYPEYARARLELIRELLGLQRHADALVEIAKETAARGDTAETYYLAARAHAGSGDLQAARQAAQRMKQENPRVPDSVLKDVLDEWKKSFGIDDATYRATLQQWMTGS